MEKEKSAIALHESPTPTPPPELEGPVKAKNLSNFNETLNMTFIALTREKNMYFGAKKELILQARELRKDMTRAEEILWSFLRKQQINGTIFRRQHPIDIFIVDFYCHKYKLVIEVDGYIHDLKDISERDENRTYELEQFGLKVIRFTNEEVITQTKNVLETIKDHLSC